MLENKTYTT